jgi:enterochelin esterase-like enzyme
MESYPVQIETNRRMRDALTAKGYPVGYFEYDGGHSFLNWSGGVENGLKYLIRQSNLKDAGSHN